VEFHSFLYHSVALELLYQKSFESNSIRSTVQLEISRQNSKSTQDGADGFCKLAATHFVLSTRTQKRVFRAFQELFIGIKQVEFRAQIAEGNATTKLYFHRKSTTCQAAGY
jgi:hypothetical protein